MYRRARDMFRFALTCALALVLMLSTNANSLSYDPVALGEVIAKHQAEIADHGHSHDDIEDVVHAFQSHHHEFADHDHGAAYLPPRARSEFVTPDKSNWALARTRLTDPRGFELDRPPRA
jgi:hypothetical protein